MNKIGNPETKQMREQNSRTDLACNMGYYDTDVSCVQNSDKDKLNNHRAESSKVDYLVLSTQHGFTSSQVT